MHLFKPSGLPRQLRFLAMTGILDSPLDGTVEKTTSHLTKLANNASQIAGYSQDDMPVF
jgi:hypothetical protein